MKPTSVAITDPRTQDTTAPQVIGPRGQPMTIILVNGHSIEPTPND